jgi:hypothetical protein
MKKRLQKRMRGGQQVRGGIDEQIKSFTEATNALLTAALVVNATAPVPPPPPPVPEENIDTARAYALKELESVNNTARASALKELESVNNTAMDKANKEIDDSNKQYKLSEITKAYNLAIQSINSGETKSIIDTSLDFGKNAINAAADKFPPAAEVSA